MSYRSEVSWIQRTAGLVRGSKTFCAAALLGTSLVAMPLMAAQEQGGYPPPQEQQQGGPAYQQQAPTYQPSYQHAPPTYQQVP